MSPIDLVGRGSKLADAIVSGLSGMADAGRIAQVDKTHIAALVLADLIAQNLDKLRRISLIKEMAEMLPGLVKAYENREELMKGSARTVLQMRDYDRR